MSDIEQLHQRISAAMDRVAYGLTQLDGGGSGDAEALQAQLAEEKTVTAQLEERVSAMKEKLAAQDAAHQAAFAELQGKLEALDTEAQKVRASNDKLLESLRNARELERAEADAILTALAPALAAEREDTDA